MVSWTRTLTLSLINQDSCLIGGAEDGLISRSILKHKRNVYAAQRRGGNSVTEENDRTLAVVLP